MSSLDISYKIYLEAEDVSQSRIHSSTSSITAFIKNHQSPYISGADIDDESDLEEFTFRLFMDETIHEDECSHDEDAKLFIEDMADLLSAIAHMHSYLDMTGEFSISYGDLQKSYRFSSESGDSLCDFTEPEA